MRVGRRGGENEAITVLLSNSQVPEDTPVYTGDPGDAPGYVTGVSHNSPSIATRLLGRFGVAASRRPERAPLANVGLDRLSGAIR